MLTEGAARVYVTAALCLLVALSAVSASSPPPSGRHSTREAQKGSVSLTVQARPQWELHSLAIR